MVVAICRTPGVIILVLDFFKMKKNFEKPNLITDVGISCHGFEMEIPKLVFVYSDYTRCKIFEPGYISGNTPNAC